MDKGAFIQHIQAMVDHLNNLQDKLQYTVMDEGMWASLMSRLGIMIGELSLLRQRVINSPTGRNYRLSDRYTDRVDEIKHDLDFANIIALVELGYMTEVRITAADVDAGELCVICLKDFEEDVVSGALRCSHSFHRMCIMQWLEEQTTCPICRRSVTIIR